MGQEAGEKWTAAVNLQPTLPKPDRLLEPHDLLYALNRFSDTVGSTTRAAGGVPNQFMGDRVMVLFGLDVELIEANRQALRAATKLDRHLDALHLQLQRELGCDTEHVIHLHTGMAAIGETGDRLTRTLTAAGGVIDDVRLLAALGEHFPTPHEADQVAGRMVRIGPIVISRAVCVTAQRDMQSLVWRELELPGGRRIEMARLDPASAGLT